MALKIQPFRKKKLTQDEIAKLCIVVSNYCKSVSIPQLAARINSLDNAINIFQALIHPVRGSELTVDVLEADDSRDTILVGFAFYLEFTLRHTDPAMVRAARELKVVMDTPSYKRIYETAYNRESNLIANLIEELRNNHQSALTQLNIGFYIDALEAANNNFDAIYENRVHSTARSYNSEDILEARTKMEKAFDSLCDKLELLAADAEDDAAMGVGGTTGGMPTGGGTTGGGMTTLDYAFYESLFATINEHIGNIVAAANHRITMGQKAKGNAEDGSTTPTPETPTNNNGNENNGENGGENDGENTNTDNTDPNQGEDNTPSANA
ncbi:MAG: hypothetical protein J5605_03500 [Bacteroidales bacterium]|nr:hypothetical protein [Bacteroidales bacterium]